MGTAVVAESQEVKKEEREEQDEEEEDEGKVSGSKLRRNCLKLHQGRLR